MARNCRIFLVYFTFMAMGFTTACSRNPLGEDLAQLISNLGFTLNHNCSTDVTEFSAFTCQIQTSESVPELIWALEPGSTCSWAAINVSTGEISGTTTGATANSCNLIVSARNSNRRSQPLSLSITISSIAPTLVIGQATVSEDSPLTIIRSDADVQSSKEALGGNYQFDHATTTAPACLNHALALTINAVNGEISYQPAADYNGSCNIKVIYDDGGGFANSTVTAEFSVVVSPVNDAPVLAAIANQTVIENSSLNLNFTANDIDSALDCASSVAAVSTNTALISVANIVFSGTVPNCIASLTPELNITGTSNITFQLSDGSLSATQSFLFTVTPLNNPPTISYSGLYSLQVGQALVTPISPTLGGGAPTACAASPALPSGLSINPTTCEISGTPTIATAQQLYTVTASNAYGSGVGTVSIGVVPAGPNNISLTGVANFTSATCASFSITTRDAYGNVTSVSSDTTFNLSGAGTNGSFFSDSSCVSATSSLILTNGNSSATFYYRKTTAGSATIVATLSTPATPAITGASRNVTVSTSTPARLELVVAATGTTVSCNSVAINLLDSNNNLVDAPANRTVNLSATASAVFYSSSTCGTSITNTTITAGTNSATVYMRKTTTGSTTLTASSAGVGNGSGSTTISLAPAGRIRFSATATSPYATSTCQAYTLQTRDSLNNNTSAVAVDTVVLLSGAEDGNFYSNSTCTPGNQITSTTITSGSSTRTIYYSKPTTTGTVPGTNITLTASVAGWSPDATTSVEVSTGVPTHLGTTNTAVGISILSATNVAIASRCLLTTVRVHDESNVLVPAARVLSNITATLSGGGAGAQFWSNATCTTPISTITINAGTNTRNFYYSSTTTTPTVAISWTNGGLSGTGGSRNVTVSSGEPSRLTWTTAPTTFNTNTCQTFTFNVRDPNTVTNIGANVSSVTDFQLSDASDGIFYSNAGCVNPTTTASVANGAQAATFYYRKATAGSVTVSVSLQSPLTPAIATLNRAVTVTAPPLVPNNILITAAPATGLVANQACSLLTLQSRNGTTPANVTANSTFTLAATNGAVFYFDSGCTAVASPAQATIASGSNSISSLYVRGVNSGNSIIGGTGPITVNSLILNYSPTPPTALALTGPSVVVAGVSCGAYTVSTQDASGINRNVLSNTTVSVASSVAQPVQFYTNSTCTTPLPSDQVTVTGGTSNAVFYMRGNSVGAAQIQVTAPGLTSASQSLTVQ